MPPRQKHQKEQQRPAKKLKVSEPTHKLKPTPKSSLKKPSTSQLKTLTPKPSLAKVATNVTADTPKKPSLKDKKGKAKATQLHDEPTPLPSTFKIMAGSYEKLLYGLEGTVTVEESSHKFHLKPMFMFPAHISSVKAVAASPHGGKWLATGSADEIIKVWDLRRKKEVGGLMHHEGSITHLEFPSRSHLLSASEDGTLCIFRARDWSVLRALKGHKGRVNSVAVHPSGKVALSVGKDRTLRMWDLMRGKGSASTKLGKEGELVRWNADGTLFVVQTQSTLDIYTTDMELIHTLQHPSRIHDLKFCKHVEGGGELLLVAAEDNKVSAYDISSDHEKVPSIIAHMVGHENRVKAIDTLSIALPPIPSITRTLTTLVSTISSDGRIRVYDLAAVPLTSSTSDPVQIEPLTVYNSKGSRLTCMAMADGDVAPSVNGKRKRKDDEEAEESADECAQRHNPGGEISEEEDASEEGESVGEEEDEEEEEGEEEREGEIEEE